MSSTNTDPAPDGPTPNQFLNGVLERITDGRRRILSILVGRSSPVPEEALASRLVEASADDDAETAVRSMLYHVHLPVLSDVGLVEWDQSAGTVTTADHPAFESSWFHQFVAADTDLDGTVDCLTDRRRRHVLDALSTLDGPVEREELAREVAARESDEEESGAPNDVRLSLHHVHLPKLDATGVVEYDPDEGLVSCESPPVPDGEWFEFLVADGSSQ